jgi:GNAT superfamily N-acetyltransferase
MPWPAMRYAVLFRKRPACRFTVKHSIYVHPDRLRLNVGRVLLTALIQACASAGFRQMIGYIDSGDVASLRLHEACGFRQVGRLRRKAAAPNRDLLSGCGPPMIMVRCHVSPAESTLRLRLRASVVALGPQSELGKLACRRA